MPLIREIWAAPLALVLAASGSCGPSTESVADYEVKIAVRRYNEALPQAYAQGSAAVLAGTATPDEMQRVDDIIGFLAQDHRVMDARQENAQLGAVTRHGSGQASVEASEQWWYRHYVPTSGEVRQAPRRVLYKNRYSLRRVEGRWLVDKLEELGFTSLPPKNPR